MPAKCVDSVDSNQSSEPRMQYLRIPMRTPELYSSNCDNIALCEHAKVGRIHAEGKTVPGAYAEDRAVAE
ncbi:hypothetical protein CVS30_08695 [Arthrobacter psychrolactophilus]|uniref:Uncharacterized protein n=1 Tax=Arthrobacter psychrolactophilus TaxID=92442 RepID=A0A2V5IWL5_9MICC|nr:hypothetical protein CVS30_08695 [Arthrobacter psychrolactophilus]